MPEKQYSIRPAAQEDAHCVAGMWNIMAEEHRSFDAEFWNWNDDAVEIWSEKFKELIEDDQVVTLVAQAPTGELAGYIVASGKEDNFIFTFRRAEIWDLVVLPDHRNSGIGTSLMEAASEELKKLGIREITLHVAIRNKKAIRFYEKIGMKPLMYRMFKQL